MELEAVTISVILYQKYLAVQQGYWQLLSPHKEEP